MSEFANVEHLLKNSIGKWSYVLIYIYLLVCVTFTGILFSLPYFRLAWGAIVDLWGLYFEERQLAFSKMCSFPQETLLQHFRIKENSLWSLSSRSFIFNSIHVSPFQVDMFFSPSRCVFQSNIQFPFLFVFVIGDDSAP